MNNKAFGRICASGVTVLVAVAAASYIFAIADTPENLIVDLQKAASSGNTELFLSGMTNDSRISIEKFNTDRDLLNKAQKDFRAALDEKFGLGPELLTAPPEDLRTTIGRIVSVEVASKKQTSENSAELKLRTDVKGEGGKMATVENTVYAVKEVGIWKLAPAPVKSTVDTARIKAMFDRLAADVRAGRYQDRMAAMIALDNSLRMMEVK